MVYVTWKVLLLWGGCFAVVGVAMLAMVRVIQRPKNEGTAGRCGYCGYSVEGLQNMQCPECGHDLRKVGITPAYQLSKSYLLVLIAALAFLIVMLFLGIVAAFIARM